MDIKELFIKYSQTKDIELRNELVQQHMYIAELLARKYIGKGIDYEDIVQVASLGLIYAVERFDISKGFEFSSFVTPTIIGEIKRYFRDKGWSVRVPRRVQELSKKVSTTKNDLQNQLGRVPTVKEIASKLEITIEETIEALEAANVYTSKSLDFTIATKGEESEVHFHEIVGEEDAMFLEIENKDFIDRIVQKFDEAEKTILQARYFDNKTQIEVANELGVSQMTISRMEKKIITKFKDEYRKMMQL